MNGTKIRLSAAEMEMAADAELILTKNRIMEKIRDLFTELVHLQNETLEEYGEGIIPEPVLQSSWKISKGERYLGLPWVVLDHPRLFSKDHIMAIRTLFWWGRHFSVTLHVSGSFKSQFENKILEQYERISTSKTGEGDIILGREFYCASGTDPWAHHFESGNYRMVSAMSRDEWEETIRNKPFIKIAKKIPMEQWHKPYDLKEILAWHYYSLVALLIPGA